MVNENLNIARVARGMVIEDFGTSLSNSGAVTDVLYVHPDGSGTDGFTWTTAYTTINAAIAAASTDANDMTLILMSPGTWNVDIAGSFTITANVAIRGAGTTRTQIRNSNASNVAVFDTNGKNCHFEDLSIYRSGTCDGIRVYDGGQVTMKNVYFDFQGTAGAGNALNLNGVSSCTFEDILIIGDSTNTVGILMQYASKNHFTHVHVNDCVAGIKFTHASGDENVFHEMDIHGCTIGIDLDAGNGQHFEYMSFEGNTTNIDDEVGDAHWLFISGNFIVGSFPQNLAGVTVADGAAGAYGSYVEIIAAATNDGPFRIVGASIEAEDAGHHAIRLSADDGTTYFYEINIDVAAATAARTAISLPAGTEFIFNKGTKITAAWKSSDGNSEVNLIWLQRQYMR